MSVELPKDPEQRTLHVDLPVPVELAKLADRSPMHL